MKSDALRFGPAVLARITGCTAAVASLAFSRLEPPDLLYRPLAPEKIKSVIADIEETIRSKPLRVVGADDPAVWERGWAELAATLASQQITTETLRPQYFHAEVPCRLFGEFVEQITPDFEYWVGLCVRFVTFATHIDRFDHVIEFGCGTGINLLLLAMLRPGGRLTGCDWARPSQSILVQMARESGQAIEGHRYNMLTATGETGLIDGNSAILTVHALEQLGTGWPPFLDFLLAQSAGLYVHIEPLLELYESTSGTDDLMRAYHQKRHYLEGYVPAIKKLAAAGRADIIALRRCEFSGMYQEAYSVLIWRRL